MKGPKNTLTDLNNILFEQLERLNDEELTAEELQTEINRAKSMSGVAAQIVSNAELAFKTMVHRDEYGYEKEETPQMLEVRD